MGEDARAYIVRLGYESIGIGAIVGMSCKRRIKNAIR